MPARTLYRKLVEDMRIRIDGTMPLGTTSKDLVLAVIGRIGAQGGPRFDHSLDEPGHGGRCGRHRPHHRCAPTGDAAMTEPILIEGRAAALRIENLDTDQIMPKQCLRGIDKSGLEAGLLYDLRFDVQGRIRPDFVLNRASHAAPTILIGGANFGCGSSREHAVWGLQQFGMRAVIAPSFAEIFYSNAMTNRLLLVTLPRESIAELMDESDEPSGSTIRIDVTAQTLRSRGVEAGFELMPRHRRMFLEGLATSACRSPFATRPTPSREITGRVSPGFATSLP